MFIDPQISTCQCLPHKCLGVQPRATLHTNKHTDIHTAAPQTPLSKALVGGKRKVTRSALNWLWVPVSTLPLTCIVVLGKS